jgi:hypothetical protein
MKKKYDILELQSMPMGDLRKRAVTFDVDENLNRQGLMYGILDAQAGITGEEKGEGEGKGGGKGKGEGGGEGQAKIYNDRSEYDLVKKLEALKVKHDAMCEELSVKTANLEELLRQVHLIEHKIEVAEQRLAGEWVSDHPETAHTRIARVSENIHSLNK